MLNVDLQSIGVYLTPEQSEDVRKDLIHSIQNYSDENIQFYHETSKAFFSLAIQEYMQIFIANFNANDPRKTWVDPHKILFALHLLKQNKFFTTNPTTSENDIAKFYAKIILAADGLIPTNQKFFDTSFRLTLP